MFPGAMPCVQTQCGSSPQGASPASQSAGGERSCDFLTPEFVKFSMDLTNSEISAATSGSGFATLGDSYGSSYDVKPPCLFQMPMQGELPCVKVEDAHRYQPSQHHQSEELLSSPGSVYYYRSPSPHAPNFQTPPGHLWEDSGSLYSFRQDYLAAAHRKNTLSRFSLFSLKHAQQQSFPTCQMKFDGSLHVSMNLDAAGAHQPLDGSGVLGSTALCVLVSVSPEVFLQRLDVASLDGCSSCLSHTCSASYHQRQIKYSGLFSTRCLTVSSHRRGIRG